MAIAARMQKRLWNIFPADQRAGALAKDLNISPIVGQVLLNRGVLSPQKARSFLSPSLNELIEPEKMPGMTQAVERITQALNNGERIAIYGDYDVDGITSVSILWWLFTHLDGNVEYYIPHRIDEGYGLNTEAIEQLAQSGVNLIITVDCGIGAHESIKLANQLGVDVIITDHHRISEKLPQAAAIVHPLLDENYGNKDSAGAMVAMKLAWAIVNQYKKGGQNGDMLREFLLNATTLAALGTIADVVDLRGENRILTSYGLKSLAESKLCGIRAMIHSAGLEGSDVDSYQIAFRLAPMLNAAGRMGHARLAVELLTSESQMRCLQTAEYLKDQNRQRQQCQRKIFTQVREMVRTTGLNHPDRKAVVLGGENWHSGVLGIVAAKVVDEFLRPAVMINKSENICQGSARSVAGFNMYEALCACSEHLVTFGGHAMAAGLRIERNNIEKFTETFEAYAGANLESDLLVSHLDIDAVCDIGDFNEWTVKQLGLLEPFGEGNRAPVFATNGVRLIAPPRRVGARNDHLQIAISDNTGSVRCIGFGMGKLEKKLLESEFFNVAYEARINKYNGNSSVQFVLSDIQF